MTLTRELGISAASMLLCIAPAFAQLSATQRAGFNLPPPQTPAPNTPGGGVVVGSNLYTGDAANGFRHWKPANPANPDPINSGFLVFDPNTSFSLGGTGLCLPFCQVGQIAFDGSRTVYLPAYDHPKGNGATMPGVWRVAINPATGQITNGALLAPNAGLAGNNPTSAALGPDGNLYIGFLKNGNVVRIVNPSGTTQAVQAVGSAPSGRPVRSMVFVGADLYLAHTQGLAVIKNAVASTCLGGCNAVPVSDGFLGVAHVGLTTDGINLLYVAIDNQVWRYTISSGAMQPISTGGSDPNTGAAVNFAFVAGHSNLLMLDRLGNLWIGDDTSDGAANFSGRIWYLSAGALSTIP